MRKIKHTSTHAVITKHKAPMLSRVMAKCPRFHPTPHRTGFHFYKVSGKMAIRILKKLCVLVAQVLASSSRSLPKSLDKMKPLGLSSTNFQRVSFYTYLLVFLGNTCSHCDGRHCNGNCSWS